jgi:hypothetical protein
MAARRWVKPTLRPFHRGTGTRSHRRRQGPCLRVCGESVHLPGPRSDVCPEHHFRAGERPSRGRRHRLGWAIGACRGRDFSPI